LNTPLSEAEQLCRGQKHTGIWEARERDTTNIIKRQKYQIGTRKEERKGIFARESER
jgi:hypothetical protein